MNVFERVKTLLFPPSPSKPFEVTIEKIVADYKLTKRLYLENLKIGLKPQKHWAYCNIMLKTARQYEDFLGGKIEFLSPSDPFDKGLMLTFPDGSVKRFYLNTYPFFEWVMETHFGRRISE